MGGKQARLLVVLMPRWTVMRVIARKQRRLAHQYKIVRGAIKKMTSMMVNLVQDVVVAIATRDLSD